MIGGMNEFFFTDSLEQDKAFYEAIIGKSFESYGPAWHSLPLGNVIFALHSQNEKNPADTHKLHFSFNVTEIDMVLARCKEAGGEIVKDVYDEAFGKVAIVKDPQGRLIELVQH